MSSLLILLSILSVWPDTIPVLHLEFDPDQWEYACENYWEDIYLPAELSCNGSTISCQFRIRGATSRSYLKKSIKIEPATGFTLFGSDELNLNAEFLDKTRLRELLSYLFYAETGQTVPEVHIVEVLFNGETQGAYISVEDVDSDFLLNTELPDQGVIYKCSDRYTTLDRADNLEPYSKKTEEQQPWDDLVLLIYWLQLCPDEIFREQLQQRFHYQDLVSCIATNVLLGHGSTYYHNYHLLLDETGAEGRWRYIAWDMDRTWGKYGPEFPYFRNSSSNHHRRNTLIWRMWCNPEIREELISEIHYQYPVLADFAQNDIIDSLAVLIAPLVEKDPFRDYTMDAFWTAIEAVQNWPEARYDNLQTQFSQWPLPFRIYPAMETGSDILISWQDAGSQCTWRVTVSPDSEFSDPGDILYETFLTDTFLVIPGQYTGEDLWLQVYCTRNGIEQRSGNGPVPPVPESSFDITGSVVISEINYLSSTVFNPGDWLELYNSGESQISLAGWSIRDGNPQNLTTIGNLILQPGECAVFASDSILFTDVFQNSLHPDQELNFNLMDNGEKLMISDPAGKTMDSLNYSPDPPWPGNTSGTGFTLLRPHICQHFLHWIAGPFGGTPFIFGEGNTQWTARGAVSIRPVGPFPVSGNASVILTAITSVQAEVTLFDLTGRSVLAPEVLDLETGEYSLTLQTGNLPPGLYFINLRNMGFSESVKIVVTE